MLLNKIWLCFQLTNSFLWLKYQNLNPPTSTSLDPGHVSTNYIALLGSVLPTNVGVYGTPLSYQLLIFRILGGVWGMPCIEHQHAPGRHVQMSDSCISHRFPAHIFGMKLKGPTWHKEKSRLSRRILNNCSADFERFLNCLIEIQSPKLFMEAFK